MTTCSNIIFMKNIPVLRTHFNLLLKIALIIFDSFLNVFQCDFVFTCLNSSLFYLPEQNVIWTRSLKTTFKSTTRENTHLCNSTFVYPYRNVIYDIYCPIYVTYKWIYDFHLIYRLHSVVLFDIFQYCVITYFAVWRWSLEVKSP